MSKEKPTLLTRDQILSADDSVYEDVNVPEWGGVVRIRGLSGSERDRFEDSIVNNKVGKHARQNMKNIRAKLVALTVIDAKGETLFTLKDVEALGKKSAAALDRCFDVAQRLCGLSDDDVTELEENFS